jgi:CBS domain-containing protein
MQSEVGSVNPQQNLSEALEIMFKNRYHDALVEKDGVFQGVVTWGELMKVKPEQRTALKVEQMPLKSISVFQDEAILEAYKIMTREKIDLLPVIDRSAPSKVMGVLTSESVANAYEKAKNLR